MLGRLMGRWLGRKIARRIRSNNKNPLPLAPQKPEPFMLRRGMKVELASMTEILDQASRTGVVPPLSLGDKGVIVSDERDGMAECKFGDFHIIVNDAMVRPRGRVQ